MSAFTSPHRRRIALVGGGMIGGQMAMLCSLKQLGDVVLFDVVPNMPYGKALDIRHLGSVVDSGINVYGANEYVEMTGAEVVIITAGITKLPGKSDKEWSRTDLLPVNRKIIREVGAAIRRYCPDAFIINITNPLDVMVRELKEVTGVPDHKIVGMSGMLDSSRFRRFLAEKLNVSPRDVQGMVIGVHGENMLPLVRYAAVNGIPLNECIRQGWITKDEVDVVVARTKAAGNEIVQLLGQGSAYFAPAAAAITMAESYFKDQKRCIVCSCCLKGQYGLKDRFLGVPAIIGGNGVERVIELELNSEESNGLQASIQETESMIKILETMPDA